MPRLNGPSFKEVAATILASSKRPMTVIEIAAQAEERGLIASRGRTPRNTFSSVILRDIKSRGSDAQFIPAGKGRFAVNPKRRAR